MCRSIVSLLALGASLLACAGCISPAAPTVLDLRTTAAPSGSCRLGMRDAVWTERKGRLEVAAYGWHPREHQTYVYPLIEGYPLFLPRMLHIAQSSAESDPPVFQIAVSVMCQQLPPSLRLPDGPYWAVEKYVGTVRLRPRAFLGERRITLQDVKATSVQDPARTLLISGTVVAKQVDPQEFDRCLEGWSKLTTEMTRRIWRD